MSSAAAGSETGPGPSPGTDHQLPMQPPPPPQQQEVVVAATEVQAPAPGSVVVAASEVPAPVSVVTIVISQPEEVAPEPKVVAQTSPASLEVGDDSAMAALAAAKEAELARSDSFDEQCRNRPFFANICDMYLVCQQKSEEPLVDLGCRCRGDLSKAHRTCIDVWFRTRGSNKCEICQLLSIYPLQRRKQVQVIGFGGLIQLMEGAEEDVKGVGLAHSGLHLQF